MDYKLLGKRIREERLRLGKAQENLAEEVNISTAYLGQIERGERSVTLDKLIPLANKLGVSVDFLLAEEVVDALSPSAISKALSVNSCGLLTKPKLARFPTVGDTRANSLSKEISIVK